MFCPAFHMLPEICNATVMILSRPVLHAEFSYGGGGGGAAINPSFVQIVITSICIIYLKFLLRSCLLELRSLRPVTLSFYLCCAVYSLCGDTVKYKSRHRTDSFPVFCILSLSAALRGLTSGIFTVMGGLPSINNNHRWLSHCLSKQKQLFYWLLGKCELYP